MNRNIHLRERDRQRVDILLLWGSPRSAAHTRRFWFYGFARSAKTSRTIYSDWKLVPEIHLLADAGDVVVYSDSTGDGRTMPFRRKGLSPFSSRPCASHRSTSPLPFSAGIERRHEDAQVPLVAARVAYPAFDSERAA